MISIIVSIITLLIFMVIIPYLKLIKLIKKEGYDFKLVKKETMLWLEEFKCFTDKFNYKLIYFTKHTGSINGNALYENYIKIEGDWYKCRYKELKYLWKIAMYSTICHELGHKDNEPKGYVIAFNKYRRFTNYCREVRADLYSKYCLMNLLDYSKEDIIDAFKLKSSESSYINKDEDNHPSWNTRINIICKYDSFNEEVIKEIAEKLKVSENSKQYINMINWYQTHDKIRTDFKYILY
ncbi:hypothetical protein [Butyrivibrio fibrisolvens]|uniref:hypothetical protein n=1 Tax=Butyrivibrio fibrisolvens TaxID=831 RepID=UPI0003B491B9|nr:hypothetical protein [Butyrivibrio fibrisolvens]